MIKKTSVYLGLDLSEYLAKGFGSEAHGARYVLSAVAHLADMSLGRKRNLFEAFCLHCRDGEFIRSGRIKLHKEKNLSLDVPDLLFFDDLFQKPGIAANHIFVRTLDWIEDSVLRAKNVGVDIDSLGSIVGPMELRYPRLAGKILPHRFSDLGMKEPDGLTLSDWAFLELALVTPVRRRGEVKRDRSRMAICQVEGLPKKSLEQIFGKAPSGGTAVLAAWHRLTEETIKREIKGVLTPAELKILFRQFDGIPNYPGEETGSVIVACLEGLNKSKLSQEKIQSLSVFARALLEMIALSVADQSSLLSESEWIERLSL